METKLITISIPVYNRYKYFEEAIESAINQTIKCPVKVIDNNSSHKDFENYVKKLNNPLVTYYKNEENIGMVGNWNRCIEVADTPWVTILHDDDALHPRYIETILNIIDRDPDVGLISSDTHVAETAPEEFKVDQVINPTIKYIKSTFFLYRNLAPFPGIALRKSLAEKAGGFTPSLHPISDIHFWYRLSTMTKAVIFSEKLVFYRISNQQETFSIVSNLIDLTKEFRNMVLRLSKKKGLLTKLSVIRANQILIDYFKDRYPDNKLKDDRLGKLLIKPPFNGMLIRVADSNSYHK